MQLMLILGMTCSARSARIFWGELQL